MNHSGTPSLVRPAARRRVAAVAVAVLGSAAMAAEVPAGLIWSSPLDGNANAVVGGNGTPMGSPTPATDKNGNVGGAVSFNGSSDYFSVVPTQTVFTAGSISLWSIADTFTNAEAGPISVGESGGGTVQYFTLHKGWRADLDDGVTRLDAISNVVPATGVWQHLVLTFLAGGSLRLYVDGVQQTDVQSLSTAAASYTFTNSWSIGTELSTTAARFFDGTLDDVRIYDNELQPADVSALFAAGPAFVPEPGAAAVVGLVGLGLVGRRRRRR